MEKIEEIRPKSAPRRPTSQKNGVACNNNVGVEKAAVNIAFDGVRYAVTQWSMQSGRVRKDILRGLNGEFCAGQLTAIMGPSGAGKSTLLNILAGYVARGADGTVYVNGSVRKMTEFSRLSCYIQQDDDLRAMLTARELMINTAHLKLGSTTTSQHKDNQVTELLSMLGLDECQHTRCGRLSGGQKKRLSIALELITNPHVLFLDEPTTGLDSSSTHQCVSLLKMLATQGRTIICTIHQPSALIFAMFDQLYTLSAGRCVYQGPAKLLLLHLEKFGLHCPAYNNPADFLMDVAMGEFGADINQLAAAAEARTCIKQDCMDYTANCVDLSNTADAAMNGKDKKKKDRQVLISSPASSYLSQFHLLLCRNLTTVVRDNSRILVRLAAHVMIAIIFGYLYRGVGHGATTVLGNCVFIYGTILFLVYTGKMAVTLSFPIEFNMLRREHFNRWYSLGPYFLSLILIEIPVQILCASLYLAISYPLTGQPLDIVRMWPIYVLCVTASLTAQSFGFLIGIIVPVKVAVFIGPVVAVVLSMFGFNIFYRDMPVYFRWLFELSYFRAAYHGIMFSLYDNRTTLPCPELEFYCHFKFPSKFLQEMDVVDIDVTYNTIFVICWGLCLYVFTLFAVWWRLNRR